MMAGGFLCHRSGPPQDSLEQLHGSRGGREESCFSRTCFNSGEDHLGRGVFSAHGTSGSALDAIEQIQVHNLFDAISCVVSREEKFSSILKMERLRTQRG